MKRRLYQKLILAWICFAVLSFVSVAGITSSLVEKHLIKNRTEGMYREANVIAAGRLAQNYTERLLCRTPTRTCWPSPLTSPCDSG